ncbi:MAG: YjgN family protein [Pseudomonadales bacterium]
MSDKLFDVVFKGQLLAPDRDKVLGDFSALFKITEEKSEKIFSASRTVLKKSLPENKAKLYQQKLADIGVLVILEERVTTDLEELITLEPEDEPESSPPEQPVAQDNNGQKPVEAVAEVCVIDASTQDDLSLVNQDNNRAAATIYGMAEDTSKVQRLGFSFLGSGKEYFKIWIVNIFLSIITLGVYSAWAKVRTNQYFYGNTRLDDSSFEYLANPITILKGRIVAVMLFAIYTFAQEFYPPLAGVLFLLFIIVLPWLVMRSLRFRLRNTAYRNIRFGFDGTLLDAFKAYTLMFLLLPLTLGLLFPYMIFLQNSYFINNAKYGVDGFAFNVAPRGYYRIYFTALLSLLAVLLVSGACLTMHSVLGGVVMVAGYLLVVTYLQVELINLMFDNSHLGDHTFSSALEIGSYFKLHLFNTVVIVLTLGLFYPWAKVRVARYRAEKLLLMSQGRLSHYVAAQQQDVNALGEEVGDIFDVDLAF